MEYFKNMSVRRGEQHLIASDLLDGIRGLKGARGQGDYQHRKCRSHSQRNIASVIPPQYLSSYVGRRAPVLTWAPLKAVPLDIGPPIPKPRNR